MFKKYLITLGMIAVTAVSGQVFATSMPGIAHNGGFESGFDGYITAGDSDVVHDTAAPSGTLYNPTEGDHFAKLHTDSDNSCSLLGGSACGAVLTFLEMKKGNTLTFDWAYLADENLGDTGLFLVSTDQTVLAAASDLGHHGETGWQTFSWTADEDITAMVTWAAVKGPHGNDHSALLVDNAQVLPEPGTIALLGLGLLGMAMSRRRKSL